MAIIKSLVDNSASTSPTASTITANASGDTPMQVILSGGEQVTLTGINGGNPITTSPFNFTYNSSLFPSGINPVVTGIPSGRVFVVGKNSGADILIDGLDSSKEWFPLQTNDLFKIESDDYVYMRFKDLKSPSGGKILITTNGAPITTKVVQLEGLGCNIDADFRLNVSDSSFDYGLMIEDLGSGGEKMRIDNDGVGGFDMTFKGILNKSFEDRGWRIIDAGIVYNNGAGRIAIKNLDVQYCKWTNDVPDQYRGSAISLFGQYYPNESTPVDTSYVERLILKHNILENGQYDISAQNVGYFEIDGFQLTNLNTSVPAEGEGTYHARTLDIMGNGVARNILAKNSYGVAFRLAPFNRTTNTTKTTSIASNIISDGNTRYSAVEINTYESQQKTKAGQSIAGIAKVYGVTAKDLGTAGTYTSVAVDIFGDGADTYVYNCVAVNCFTGGLASNLAINGPTAGQSNNIGYTDNTLTKLNLTTLKPASDSVLKGAGVYSANNPTDIYGDTRINPDTIGAVKAS